MKIQGKVFIVTGAGSGIGRELVLQLIAKEAHVAAVDFNEKTLKETAAAHIINISSMGGFLPVPGQSVYGASKAAVKLLTEGLYAELRETNVRVSVVFPGAINTNITTNSGVHMDIPKDMDPKDIPSIELP